MVDPNRKINRLSDDDAAFLLECEHEFRNRYTEADEEFAVIISQPSKPPPIVEPWHVKQRHHGGGDLGGSWNRNNYRSHNRNHYNRKNDNCEQRNHYRPYERNERNERNDRSYRHNENIGHGHRYGQHGSSH